MIKGVLAGIFEMSQRVRGMENIMVDLASNEVLACAILDKMVELKIQFWEMALPQLGDLVDVVSEADDYGTQTSQLISPRMFRRIFKPRLQTLFTRIHQLAPHAKLFFHSDGNIRPILPDLIEIGIDILNPIHITATGMEPARSSATSARTCASGAAASRRRACCRSARRRRCGTTCAATSTRSRRAAATCSTPFTTSRPTCRRRTSWR